MFHRSNSMRVQGPSIPDGVPVLSRGKHRNPKRGACFMEFASWLAGERWSDHPACTHPALASLARCVNDVLDDSRRQELAPLIPDVVGLNGDDPRIPLVVLRRAAISALPVAPHECQNVMALALMAADRRIGVLEGRGRNWLSAEAATTLEGVPVAWAWARTFDRRVHGEALRPVGAPRVVAYAVEGISMACTSDPNGRLIDLLRTSIAETRALLEPVHEATPAPLPPVAAPDDRTHLHHRAG